MLGNGCDIWKKHGLLIVLGIFGSPFFKRTGY